MHESLIRLTEVMRRTGFSKAWIYRLKGEGLFPNSVKIGPRAIAFIESEIDSFIENRITRSRGLNITSKELTVTPSTLPQRCWRPLAEVKAFVEKFPDGVDLTQLNNRVNCYGILNKKDKNLLINHLEQRESIYVIKARPINSAGREKTFLRHKRYGYPKAISGYLLQNKEETNKAEDVTLVEEAKLKLHVIEENSTSPEALRKQAEQLLKAAEEAERQRNDNDFFNKKLAPVKLEICQAAGALQRKTDEFIDCIDVLNKAVKKLKELTA